MADAKAIVARLQEAMLDAFHPPLKAAVEDAAMTLRNQSDTMEDGHKLHQESGKVIDRFRDNMAFNFDSLTGGAQKKGNVFDYSTLSLVEEGDLEAIIALEGMIAYTRNCDISEALAFVTRLDSLFYSTAIDESNNPLDPEQIGEAFSEAVRPLALPARALLETYRQFNVAVFHKLEDLLAQANTLLVEMGVIPDLDMDARNKQQIANKRGQQRERVDPTERAFRSNDSSHGDGNRGNAHGGSAQPVASFSLIQSLMQRQSSNQQTAAMAVGEGKLPGMGGVPLANAGLHSGMMIGNQRVEILSGDALLKLLDDAELDKNLDSALTSGQALDLSDTIGTALQSQKGSKTLTAVDGTTADVISLVTLLYEAIWEDDSVPLAVKELLGRTQITLLKLAMRDGEFFTNGGHPARQLLNELAAAGIGWTVSDKLSQDPLYRKACEIVSELLARFDGKADSVKEVLEEFLLYMQDHVPGENGSLPSFHDSEHPRERIEEINNYAWHKIRERILEQQTPKFVIEFLEQYFCQFLVQVILREGPGGSSWRPVMNTIDVLLWTVQPEKESGDQGRFDKVNKRLMINLNRALHVAGVEKDKASELLEQLRAEQKASFDTGNPQPEPGSSDDASFDSWLTKAATDASSAGAPLSESDEHLQEVSSYPIGIWLEFVVDEERSIRCTLAAHIKSIDKYIFVNGQGVKVVEKSRLGLARELKSGTVKVISQSPLIDRAMESVVGKLRQREGAAPQRAP